MPTITVSEEVARLIDALKQPGEESPDETLSRVLSAAAKDQEDRLRADEAADQDTSSTN